MTPEETRHLIEQGEGQTVEFKSSFAEENDAIVSLCAFANADGGTVLFGVRDDGQIVGVSLGKNTRENFANKLKSHTSPLLRPQIDFLTLDSLTIVAATTTKAARGQLFAAFNKFCIRVDKTNQTMSSDEIRARHRDEGQQGIPQVTVPITGPDRPEEHGRPHFEVGIRALSSLESNFEPQFNVSQSSGDPVADLEWRIRGPRFSMDWRQASGSALQRTHFAGEFDLSRPPHEDDKVGLDEMGFEIRFHWQGQFRYEIHRWSISRRELTSPPRVHWEVGSKILPPLYELFTLI